MGWLKRKCASASASRGLGFHGSTPMPEGLIAITLDTPDSNSMACVVHMSPEPSSWMDIGDGTGVDMANKYLTASAGFIWQTMKRSPFGATASLVLSLSLNTRNSTGVLDSSMNEPYTFFSAGSEKMGSKVPLDNIGKVER